MLQFESVKVAILRRWAGSKSFRAAPLVPEMDIESHSVFDNTVYLLTAVSVRP